jgi:hypothetical protein
MPSEGEAWVNHSGGVRGADMCWQQLGLEYQVVLGKGTPPQAWIGKSSPYRV